MWWIYSVNAYHAGSVVGQHYASEWTRREAGQFEHADTIKSGHFRGGVYFE